MHKSNSQLKIHIQKASDSTFKLIFHLNILYDKSLHLQYAYIYEKCSLIPKDLSSQTWGQIHLNVFEIQIQIL
jgi:hypothetical protein